MEIGGPCNWLSPLTMLWAGPRKPPGKRRAFLHHQSTFSSLSHLGKAIVKAHFLEAFLFGAMLLLLLLSFSSTMANATTLYHGGSGGQPPAATTPEPSPTPPNL
jgi:hypothetical protein